MTLDDLEREAAELFAVTVVDRIGDGGEKSVLSVRTADGGDAAMLVVKLDGSYAAMARRRAEREVSLLAAISSPHVVKVLAPLIELDGGAGVAWLEELLPGDDLSKLLGTQWSWEEAKALAHGLAAGLAAFHERDVVHRDLSARNVMRTAPYTYTIIDPGLARHLKRTVATGVFEPGTLGFMSPEHVLDGVKPNRGSDVFSAGVLLYLVLTGEAPIPFRGDFDDYAERLRDAQVPQIQDHRADLPDGAAALVHRCLERQGARRFLDGAELLAAVEVL